MTELVSDILGLGDLRFGGEGVRLGFARSVPAWGWALAVTAGGVLAWATYARLAGPKRVRTGLAAIRTATLVLLLLLAAGPQLVRENERTEQDWVVVLVDRSASLTVPDAPDGPGGRTTREAQLRQAFESAGTTWRELDATRRLLMLGFDSGAFDLETIRDGGELTGFDLGEADGRRTAIGASIEEALRRVAARPVAGLVVLSDGRSADELPRSAARRLSEELIPVFAMPLGSADAPADLAVASVDAPSAAFVSDRVPVTVAVERRGGTPDDGSASVRLIDRATGLTLDERRVRAADYDADGRAVVTLLTRPEDAGDADWLVEIDPDGGDLIEANNREPLTLSLVDRPLRVVYFDGYPRWEFRYLKNILLRERSIDSSNLLLATERSYIQEGDSRLDALPGSSEEWAPFDVVVMGDVRANLFSERQLEQLREHVALRGAGLLFIAGPGSTPGTWFGTALGDLLPFRASGGSRAGVRAWEEPVTMAPTALAERLGLLNLGGPSEGLGSGEPLRWPSSLSDPMSGWSTLRFAQRLERSSLKPAAEVLAVGVPVSAGGDASTRTSEHPEASALVVTMRYGAGRVTYVATDETWRWRYARGETLTERFWVPLVRDLGRAAVERGGRPALLEAAPDRPVVRQPVRVGITLLDQSLLDASPGSLRVRVSPASRPGSEADAGEVTELTLGPAGEDGERGFQTTWLPTRPGVYVIEPADPLLAGLGLSATVDVGLPDDEMRTPQADHAFLASLASSSGGRVLSSGELSELPGLLPNREVVIAAAPDVATLWDRPVWLVLLVLLLGTEWVVRRLIKLA
ncbi:MAG: hypothetical protein EA378_10730 [Phycisphaerales bacterium]|nr:MAG: hypothetical protein EA378_10730 [Phycisphaerales bacterium]